MLSESICIVVSVFFLLVASVVGAGDNPNLISTCRESERQALLNFKADLVDEVGILSSWGNNGEKDCCKWQGVRCSNLTGNVIILNVPGHYDNWGGLSGNISSSLVELTQLKYLDLSSNHFGESLIPSFIGSFSSLQYLNLSSAEFSGAVPSQLGNLTNLRSLYLGFNDGLTLGDLDWISHLRSLTHLDLSAVDFKKSSDWLQQIYKLSSLTKLLLRSCNLLDSPLLPINTTSLNSLAVVDLSDNNFISPSSYNWLFNFSHSLVHVDLSSNSIRGSVPEAFGSMPYLESLSLADCQLEGVLPKSFANLSRLDTLYLLMNNFNSTLYEFLNPLAVTEKKSLEVLNLDMNLLSGSLPDFLTNFPSLRELSIRENNLSGSFPKNFGQLSRLVHLDISLNQLTGPFPDTTSFSSLETLFLYNNNLNGTIPETYLSNLSKLIYFGLSLNSVSLNFSVDWVPPFHLEGILLENCVLGPRFPNWLRSQHNLIVLDISGASISDTIPLWLWDLSPRLTYLNISNNNIQGSLPDLSLKFALANTVFIDLRSNNLKGIIPSFPTNVGFLDLSKNMLNGSLSFLCTTPNNILQYLDLSDNQLSGELPDCWVNFNQLQILNLANNNLYGKVPTSMGLLNQVTILQLCNNSLSEELPSSLMDCKNLLHLDLSENRLTGEVPTWIGTHLTSLVIFSLRRNEFSGTVPRQICHLVNAQVVDLSRNNLSGSIPNCINNLTSLVERENSNAVTDELNVLVLLGFSGTTKYAGNTAVTWKGVVSEYKKTLGLLKLIDLSSNRLIGKIPKEFASLKGLISLNLSSNSLTGNIISKIGQMENLENLDLSRNHLSGEIPSGLASLTLLSVLDLSNNNLQGEIPTSTQLQSFDPSKFARNEHLCGLPLPNKCRAVHSLQGGHDQRDESNEEDENGIPKIGLYVSMVLGFITGFWVFITPITLRRNWRHSYYKFLGGISDWVYVRKLLNMTKLKKKFHGKQAQSDINEKVVTPRVVKFVDELTRTY